MKARKPKGRDPMLMRGHKRRPKHRASPEMEAQAERRGEIAKAEIFAPQVFEDGSAVLPLSPKERDTINTMIDFFRSSDEDEHLEPEVYEAIAEKLGNGRRTPFEQALKDLDKLVSELWELAADTVGFEDDERTIIAKGSAQEHLYALAKRALEGFKRVAP